MTRLTLHTSYSATLHIAPWLAWLLGIAPDRNLEQYVAAGGRLAWAYSATGRDVPEWVARMIDSEQRKQAAGRRIAELQRGVYP